MKGIYWENLECITNEYTCLIAGTIGSGKSVLLDDLIFNFASQDVMMGIIDLKRVQYNKWVGLPHLRDLGIAKDINSALYMIDKVTAEMESRYRIMESTNEVKYNGQRIVLIIDEMADLMTYKGVEAKLTHLMRLCRAANISVFMATQSPSRKVITANIQNCTTSALGLRCRSSVESRQIIGIGGCENLPKYGYGIFWNSNGYLKLEIPITPDQWIQTAVNNAISLAKPKKKHWWQKSA